MRKNTINKLIQSPVTVRLWNGCFNQATSVVELRSCKYELRVDVTHPLLHWQCGNQNGVKLLKWVGCSGEFIAIPVEISEKIAEMQKLATMTDEQARNLSAENQRAFAHAMYELGIE